MKPYPKKPQSYYNNPFWWNEEKPWFIIRPHSNGGSVKNRFSTHEEAFQWLNEQHKVGYLLGRQVECDQLWRKPL
jgi:hypothetical protein